jgi:peptidyl-Lys metalloendopeptidase
MKTSFKKSFMFALILLALTFGAVGIVTPAMAAQNKVTLDPARGPIFSPAMVNEMAVSLSVDQTSFGETENVVLHVTITNPGSQTIKVLKWFTPFSDFMEPLFNVSVDGKSAAFIGALYKRAAPTEQDYITLAAGESLTGDVNLGSYYDLSASGNYAVNYSVSSASLYLGEASGQKLPAFSGRLSSNAIDLFVDGREITRHAITDTQLSAASASNTFNGCSSTRQKNLITARSKAKSYATNAVNYFNSNLKTARYTTWFGSYSSTRYNKGKTHFSNIKNATATAAMNFDCTCADPGVYAYVYPSEPYYIYLCGAFWVSPMTGTDSKAGTLIHELSHFNVLGGTDDFVYGQTKARALAKNNPNRAVMNADNHEYFAENNPPQ